MNLGAARCEADPACSTGCRGLRVDTRFATRRISLAVVAVGLLTLPAPRALDDLEQQRPLGRLRRKELAFNAEKSCERSTLAANNISSAHKHLPMKGL
jgi:hypothetical protein